MWPQFQNQICVFGVTTPQLAYFISWCGLVEYDDDETVCSRWYPSPRF